MKITLKSNSKEIQKEQERIYDLYCKKLYFTSYRILGDCHQAEETMHDTLLKYFDVKNRFCSDNEGIRWMTRVCVNMSIDKIRKRKTEKSTLFPEEKMINITNTQIDEELTNIQGITAEMIRNGISELSDGYRIVLSLLLFEGYDYQEISQILKINEVSVRSQYLRGKARLRQVLNNR